MPDRRFEAIVAGELFTDLILSGFDFWPRPGEEAFAKEFHREVGGGAANTACGMAKDPSGARTEPGSGTAKFLVVPLAVERAHGRGYDGPPSLHVCGDARTIGGGSGDGGVAIS